MTDEETSPEGEDADAPTVTHRDEHRWEYASRPLVFDSEDALVGMLNEMGDAEWELATVVQDASRHLFLFKRPKQEQRPRSKGDRMTMGHHVNRD
jgi:hypothetical protein